jgi:hypothetical protein
MDRFSGGNMNTALENAVTAVIAAYENRAAKGMPPLLDALAGLARAREMDERRADNEAPQPCSVWKHFKPEVGLVRVLMIGRDEITQARCVIYQHMETPDASPWIRKLTDWQAIVKRGDYHGPRFTKVPEHIVVVTDP